MKDTYLKPSVNVPKLIMLTMFVIFAYKIYKLLIVQLLADYGYYYLESSYTFYRILGTLYGVYFVFKSYKNPRKQTVISLDPITLLIFLIFLPIYTILKLYFFQPQFHTTHFAYEFFFCIFTGFFEEFVFRGILLVCFLQYMSKNKAILFSSLLFTFWHWDVANNYTAFLIIFLFSILFSTSYLSKVSLINLSLFHFFVDQVHFGITWKIVDQGSFYSQYYDYSIVTLLIFSILGIWLYNKRTTYSIKSSA